MERLGILFVKRYRGSTSVPSHLPDPGGRRPHFDRLRTAAVPHRPGMLLLGRVVVRAVGKLPAAEAAADADTGVAGRAGFDPPVARALQ
jgi:hypothetical protein